jgi:hypothetical protein
MALRLAQVVNAPFFALTIVGPVAMVVESWLAGRKHAPAAERIAAA